MINGRITPEQMAWLEEKAGELGGNLSAALRQAVTDARLLEMAREDYKRIRAQYPDFEIPQEENEGSSALHVVLSIRLTETDDAELRKLEGGESED